MWKEKKRKSHCKNVYAKSCHIMYIRFSLLLTCHIYTPDAEDDRTDLVSLSRLVLPWHGTGTARRWSLAVPQPLRLCHSLASIIPSPPSPLRTRSLADTVYTMPLAPCPLLTRSLAWSRFMYVLVLLSYVGKENRNRNTTTTVLAML